jgi:long-chain fatty acid transport protein
MKTRLIAAAVGLACAATVPVALATNGYMSNGYSPIAKGMGGADTALPQDTISVVDNPAGLVEVGRRADIAVDWFSPIRKYEGANAAAGGMPIGSDPFGGEVKSRNNDFLVPTLGYAQPLDANSSVGVALFGNGGMNTQYGSQFTFMDMGTYGGNIPCQPNGQGNCFGLGGGNTGVNLEQLGLSLTYSRKMSQSFDLGASLVLAMQSFEAKGVGNFAFFTETTTQSVVANMPTIGANMMAGQPPLAGVPLATPANLTDNGKEWSYGAGVQIGGLWKVNPMFNIGLSYRSKVYMTKFDKYSDLFANGGEFDIPAVGNIGLTLKPNDKLTFALDVQEIWYSDVDSIGNPNQLAEKCDVMGQFGGTYDPSYCLGGSNGAGFGWDDQTIIKFGVQYAVNPEWTVRAGYAHATQIIPESEVPFNVLAPAVVQDHWTIGVTKKIGKAYEITGWGVYSPEETVSGSSALTAGSDPSISMKQYEVGIAFSWLFN